MMNVMFAAWWPDGTARLFLTREEANAELASRSGVVGGRLFTVAVEQDGGSLEAAVAHETKVREVLRPVIEAVKAKRRSIV